MNEFVSCPFIYSNFFSILNAFNLHNKGWEKLRVRSFISDFGYRSLDFGKGMLKAFAHIVIATLFVILKEINIEM